jgi:AAA15 family ATPase/GTPase
MIRKVKFSNFYSFRGEQEISFLASKKQTYDYFTSKNGDQITKVAAFIGGNASGKTNVMRLFSFLGYFIYRPEDEQTQTLNREIAFKTFFSNDKPSDFYIEFEENNNIYFYQFTLSNKNIIAKEELRMLEIKPYAREEVIFSRTKDGIQDLNEKHFTNISVESLPKINDSISLITYFKRSQYKVDVIDDVYVYFAKMRTNINEKGEISTPYHQLDALMMYRHEDNIKKKMESFIKDFDLGLSRFEINLKEESKRSVDVYGVHSDKKESRIPFTYESRGTRSLFFVIANVLTALKYNSVVIVDEIETGLHPEALNKLVGYFIEENKDRNAQLLFSAHSFEFMKRLDMHQIYLVEKNVDCESNVCRLNQVEGIRSDENFQAKYMSGAYGAFPEISV